ncbi:MAG TPA: hypothetical protein VF623_00150 [Segetibacter sp.]|jgi:hypothetical protein
MIKEKMLQLAHLTAGIITLIHGFDTFGTGDFKSAGGYLSLAVLFILVAGVNKWMSKQFLQANVAFFLLEAVTIIYSGWHYNTKGHKVFFYLMAAAGIVYFVLALLNINSAERTGKKRRSKKRRSSSSSSNVENQYNKAAF